MAATGKSTIAHTMAHHLYTQNKLAGSFFFRRGGGNLAKAAGFVTTLAYQLANISPPGISVSLKELVCEAMVHHSNVLAQGLRTQWKELIVEPLSRIKSTQRLVLTFIIDALHECDSEDDIRLILQLFIKLKDISAVDLGSLVTSRPLLYSFQDVPEIMHSRLDLRSVRRNIVEHDIKLFLKEELGQINPKSGAQERGKRPVLGTED